MVASLLAFVLPGISHLCYAIPELSFCHSPSWRKAARTLPSYNPSDFIHVICAGISALAILMMQCILAEVVSDCMLL